MLSSNKQRTRLRSGSVYAGMALSLCICAVVCAQQPNPGDSHSQKLYLIAATLTVKGGPSGYPVTLYQIADGKLKLVREIIPPGPSGDTANEGSMAPTSICCAPVSKNAIYFIYPYYSSTNIAIVHFDDPSRVDNVKFNAAGVFSDGMRTAVVPQSVSSDELLIPLITDFSVPAHLKGTLTRISSDSKGSHVTSDATNWNDYRGLLREGDVGGPATQVALVAAKVADNVALSVLDHSVIIDELPPALRGTKDKIVPAILAANEQFLLLCLQHSYEEMARGDLGPKFQVFVHDRVRNQWKEIRVEGNSSRLRLFGPWLSVNVASWDPKHGPNPGRERERSDATDRLPNIQSMYASRLSFGDYSIHGILILRNLSDGRAIRVVTENEDSEILSVDGDTVLYRINDAIYEARIAEGKLTGNRLIVQDDDVPEVHWVF
jgi:hypothetical protein